MNSFIDQLLAITGRLHEELGVEAGSLALLRSFISAFLLQADPALVAVVPPESDPALVAAVEAGRRLAADRTAAGIRLRFVRGAYLADNDDGQRPVHVLGPFLDDGVASADDPILVTFRIFETARLTRVAVANVQPLLPPLELPMTLPPETVGDAGLRVFTFPAGTVWLRAARIVPGAAGYVVLRVAEGRLELDRPARAVKAGQILTLAPGTGWRLSLTPTPAAPPDAAGSDGNAVGLALPTQFTLTSAGAVTLSGGLGLQGFGSDLRFDASVGAPSVEGPAMVFPHVVAAQRWSIDTNRSGLATLAGESEVVAAAWLLPITQAAPAQPFEAAHGGSLQLQVRGKFAIGLGGASGHATAPTLRLIVNMFGIDILSLDTAVAASFALSLWGPAGTEIDFGDAAKLLRLHSLQDGADSLLLAAGTLRNRWDLPLAAGGKPFAFAEATTILSFFAEPDGRRRVTGLAVRNAVSNELEGLALENAYFEVQPARQLVFAASGPSINRLANGSARLFFDVRGGEPMLPDPYAASWSAHPDDRITQGGLSVAVDWSDGAPPSVRARLEKPVNFPEPGNIPPDDESRPRALFQDHLQAQVERLSLLDLSTQAHLFGVALETLSDARPTIDAANRLTVELRDVRLLMQPQVHWEPIEVIANPAVKAVSETLVTHSHGGPTLAGANSVKLVPILPAIVGAEIAAVANGLEDAAALFSLPFGLRSVVKLARNAVAPRPVLTSINQPTFDADLVAAQQLRLLATGGKPPGDPAADPARGMPGLMLQSRHASNSSGAPSLSGLTSVLPTEIADALDRIGIEQGLGCGLISSEADAR